MNRLNRRAFLRGFIGSFLVTTAVALWPVRSPLAKLAHSNSAAGYGSAPYSAGPYGRAARYRLHLPLIQK